MPCLPSLTWLAVFYTLTAIMWGLAEPAETALVAEVAGLQRQGLGYGLYDFVESLGFTIGPLLGGLLYDTICDILHWHEKHCWHKAEDGKEFGVS
jgi:MFS family permease